MRERDSENGNRSPSEIRGSSGPSVHCGERTRRSITSNTISEGEGL